jgi:hypothetical protein
VKLRKARREGTESFTANCEAESAVGSEQLMEQVCERENLKQALRRVKANKGSPGIDGITVSELPRYKQQWPALREQLLFGTYQPQLVRRLEIAKADGGMRKLGIPTVLDRKRQGQSRRCGTSEWVTAAPMPILDRPRAVNGIVLKHLEPAQMFNVSVSAAAQSTLPLLFLFEKSG